MQEEGFWQGGGRKQTLQKEAFEMPEILAKWGRKAEFAKKKLLKCRKF